MTITLEHVPSPQGGSSTAASSAPPTAPRTGWLTLVVESVAAARAVSTADPRTSVAVAERFVRRIS